MRLNGADRSPDLIATCASAHKWRGELCCVSLAALTLSLSLLLQQSLTCTEVVLARALAIDSADKSPKGVNLRACVCVCLCARAQTFARSAGESFARENKI